MREFKKMGKYLFLAVIVTFLTSFYHPIHISILELEWDQQRKALELSQRVFADDLEKEIRREMNDANITLEELDTRERDQIFEQYLNKHISIQVDGKASTFDYVGSEFDFDVYFMYFQIVDVESVSSLNIENTILLRTYEDQINIVHTEVGETKKSLRLDGSKSADKLVY